VRITIFDVEHGACALLRADTGATALIDCGYNAVTGWRPSLALPKMGVRFIDELFVTNYDEDHVDDLPNLRRHVGIGILTRNPTVSGAQLYQIKSVDCAPGKGIRELISMTQTYNSPISSQPNWGGIEFRRYWNRYPNEFTDENNLSMALFIHHPMLSILFPGDLEKAGWKNLLLNPYFVKDLSKVHILVASHHGRDNGCCDEIFALTGWRPQIVVISDDYVQYDTQETAAWYRARASGIRFDGTVRRVFTTRSDGAIYLEANDNGVSIDTSAHFAKSMASWRTG
jgi:beta-lactamase superfamily II metal-dependent hydrolase